MKKLLLLVGSVGAVMLLVSLGIMITAMNALDMQGHNILMALVIVGASLLLGALLVDGLTKE